MKFFKGSESGSPFIKSSGHNDPWTKIVPSVTDIKGEFANIDQHMQKTESVVGDVKTGMK